MKLLYVDAYHEYLNPTSGLTAALVTAAAEQIQYYGPGYSSDAELDAGIRSFMDRRGPFDGIVLGPQVPIFAWNDHRRQTSPNQIQRHAAFGSSRSKLLRFNDDVLQHASRLPARFRFVTLLNFDYYSATLKHTDALEALDAFVIAPGIQFAPTLDTLPDWAWNEKHFVRKRHMISNAWSEFMTRWPERIISMVHFVAGGEFSFRSLHERSHRIAVPGIEYWMRKQGRKALRARGIRPSENPTSRLLRYTDRMGFYVFTRFPLLKLYHASYQGNLIDTRFVYTAPESFGIPVRKFFEIPAAGAAMLCVPPLGFSALGFRDGEHYVKVEPETLLDNLFELERDMDRAQAIAAAGRKLVFERHSLAARSRHLAECLSAIERGLFVGSRWNEGCFEVLTAADTSAPPRRAALE